MKNMQKKILLSLYGIMLFILGMFSTILIYRWKLSNASQALDSVCSVPMTGSGSFLMDWPLDILFPAVPLFIILIVAAIVINFLQKKD